MRTRPEFDAVLRSIYLEWLGDTPHIYYQPPEGMAMSYPAIAYQRLNFQTPRANNKIYIQYTVYTVTVIYKDPDLELIPVFQNLFEHCDFEREFITDGLYHTSFTIYY